MKTMEDIVETLKDILSPTMPDKIIFDKHVAEALGVSQMALANSKKRNTVPYEEIMDYCAAHRISINWLFTGQATKSLVETTNKHMLYQLVRHSRKAAA